MVELRFLAYFPCFEKIKAFFFSRPARKADNLTAICEPIV
jgi:hypothetical protein